MALLHGSFIDVLATTAPCKIPPHRPELFSLAAQHRDQLLRREGFSIVAMRSSDARRDRERFIAAGLQASDPIDVSRPVRQPNGEEATFSFSMVVVADARLGDAQHFIYQIRTPETFWHTAWQNHANGALTIGEMIMVADDPAALHTYYAALISPDAVTRVGSRLHVDTSQERIVILPPTALTERFDGIAITPAPHRPYVAGLQIRTRDLALVRRCLTQADIPYADQDAAIRVAPQYAFGGVLEFVVF